MLLQIRQPGRIQTLLIIGSGETCVCHIEAILSLHQATISHHLMSLRKAGLLITECEVRYFYYRLANSVVVYLLHHTADWFG